jgi:hypothetical protein
MATWMGTGLSAVNDSRDAARSALEQALDSMGHTENIKLCIAYINADYDLETAVNTIRNKIGQIPLIGCSTTGEFTSEDVETGAIAITTIASDQLEVRMGSATHYNQDIPTAVYKAISGFVATSENKGIRPGWQGRTLLLFTDGLAGRGEELIDELVSQTGMQYQLFGGAAADNVEFKETFVICNDKVMTDSFVIAEILSEKPFSIAADHGWVNIDGPYRVTRAQSNVVYELNGRPAWEIYGEFAAQHGLKITEGQEGSFLMQYILGIHGEGEEKAKLRVPLGLNPDGSLLCAAEVIEGDIVSIMTSKDNAGIMIGGKTAVEKAMTSLSSSEIAGALVFECVATRLHLADKFSEQVNETATAVPSKQVMGCACYGQLARTQSDFSGQGCATSLVCVLPA